MNLQQRQMRNRWKKRTYDKDLQDWFNRAPKKTKDLVKRYIQRQGFNCPEELRSFIYECHRIDVSTQVCERIIEHYEEK